MLLDLLIYILNDSQIINHKQILFIYPPTKAK
nr:MAG TPA: hypothetical protein [Bacteriophage sp.]